MQKQNVWDGLVSIFTNPDFLVLMVFCILGLLLSLAVTLAVPGFQKPPKRCDSSCDVPIAMGMQDSA